jgi:hypothetical protein
MAIKATSVGIHTNANLAETIPEMHTNWFVGKKLVKVTGKDPYIRYEFEGGGYFEQYQHLGELNWIAVENGLPNSLPTGPDTDSVLIITDREYIPNMSVAFGEYTEDGFEWHPDNLRVLIPVWGGKAKLRVTHWANLSLPINHEGKASE